MALTDYSSMENEIENAPEPTVLKKGTEVKVRIIAVRTGTVEKEESAYLGCDYFSVTFEASDEPLAKEFSDFFWDLNNKGKISEKSYLRALRHFRNFAEAFELDYSKPFDLEDDLVGLVGWVIVGIQKDDEYGDKNTVSKYVAGRKGSKNSSVCDVDESPF